MSRIKGITIWEQHAEHFAIGIAAVALVVFVAFQFIGNPNATEVPGRGTVNPGEIDDLLVQEATRLQAKLAPDAPRPEFPPPVKVIDEFNRLIAASISPAPSLGHLRAEVPLPVGERPRGEVVFIVPELPAPESAVAQQYFDTLADGVVDGHEALQSLFPNQPHDVTWITAASAIDTRSILRSFKEVPDGEQDVAAIPMTWYSDQVTVLDVRFEREELVDGQWMNRRMVEPVPGQVSYRDEIQRGIDATRRDALLQEARGPEGQRLVTQPDFFPTRNGAFLPPDPFEPEVQPVAADEGAELLLQLRRLQRERDRVSQQLQELGGPLPSGDQRPPTPRTPSPGSPADEPGAPGGPAPRPAPGGGGGIGPMGGGGGASDEQENRRNVARRNLMRRIAQYDRQIDSLSERLPQDIQQPEESYGRTDMQIVWAHDLGVEHGRTYRYRAIVDIYNPFFARRLNLLEQQQHLADDLVMSSHEGEWSEPIEARPPMHSFITSAYAAGQERGAASGESLGHVVAEVYRFYDGRWWQSRFTVEPGQLIGAQRDDGGSGPAINFGTEWFVLDIIGDIDADGREGRAARVVLQSVRSGQITEVRHPVQDLADSLRQRLSDEVRWADSEA